MPLTPYEQAHWSVLDETGTELSGGLTHDVAFAQAQKQANETGKRRYIARPGEAAIALTPETLTPDK